MKIKTTHFLSLTVIIFLIMGFSRNQTEDYHQIGDIKYSLLPPNTFAKTQKGSWALLDGKPIAEDQKLYTLLEQDFLLDIFKDGNGIVKLPDARGSFIRSMNINGQGNDPDTKRNVGSYQPDALKTHKHALQNTIYKHGRSFKGDNAKDHALKHAYGSVWASVTKNTGGAAESRPKNIALYCYVKVSN
ncbi:hypothetical protein [Kordia sp.]|uniref:hypothetical protein n=1 Tax=Kordia sp. TaxID=1965332 RepID=UPI0025C1D7B2|nr:hypothetical protein [Kordia sp.]MCH2195089.1 hypothetical protein [Kordia sp.]